MPITAYLRPMQREEGEMCHLQAYSHCCVVEEEEEEEVEEEEEREEEEEGVEGGGSCL